MDDTGATSLEQIQSFLAGSGEVVLAGQRREEVYGWVEATLVRHQYASLSRGGKGLVRRYLSRMTGLSRAQVTRLIAGHRKTQHINRDPLVWAEPADQADHLRARAGVVVEIVVNAIQQNCGRMNGCGAGLRHPVGKDIRRQGLCRRSAVGYGLATIDGEDLDPPVLAFILEREVFLRKILDDMSMRILGHHVDLYHTRFRSQRGHGLRGGGLEEDHGNRGPSHLPDSISQPAPTPPATNGPHLPRDLARSVRVSATAAARPARPRARRKARARARGDLRPPLGLRRPTAFPYVSAGCRHSRFASIRVDCANARLGPARPRRSVRPAKPL